MSLLSIYEKLPNSIQNIAVSLYGLKREHLRYGGNFSKKLNVLQHQEYKENDYIKIYQQQELKQLLIEADKSTYYHNLFLKLNVDLNHDAPINILSQLPILAKQELRGNESLFHTNLSRNDQIFHTSGSTGTPLSVRMSLEDFRQRMAILERMKLRFGVNHKSRHISFVGKKISGSKSRTFWRKNIFGNQMVMSVYDLNERNAELYIKTIQKYNPEMIEGYPSALVVVAKWIKERNVKLNVKCVLVTAETLSDAQKCIIGEGFHCPVVNYYGSTEGAPMVTQCECGNLHVEYESGIIEFLDENNQTAAEGSLAKMVVTSFLTKAMPLIRYDIGDMAIVGGCECPCGRHTQMVTALIGRCDDVFKTKEKGYVGRLSTTLKLLPSFIRRAQIQQTAIDSFVLLLESEMELSAEQELLIKKDMIDKLGTVDIHVAYTTEIPNGPNGKFRSQISMIG